MSATATETAGLGVGLVIDDTISTKTLMDILERKISNPEEFLPVTDVVCRPSDDGVGIYREMTFGAKILKENIYFDLPNLEVRFVNCDGSAEVVNSVLTDELGVRRLEFFARDTNSKEKKEWPVPKQVALHGIQKCLDAARSIDQAKVLPV